MLTVCLARIKLQQNEKEGEKKPEKGNICSIFRLTQESPLAEECVCGGGGGGGGGGVGGGVGGVCLGC